MDKLIIDIGSIFDDNAVHQGSIGFSELYVGISRSRTFDGIRLLIPTRFLPSLTVNGIAEAKAKVNQTTLPPKKRRASKKKK